MKASKVLVLVSKDQGLKDGLPTHVEVWLNCSGGWGGPDLCVGGA